MMDRDPFVSQWLADITGPLRQWRSTERSRRCLDAWVQTALRRCRDRAFADSFARGCPVAGARPADYLHRVVSLPQGRVLAGIRFKGGDVEQPFVDLLAWDHDLSTAAAFGAVVRAVFEEFALFGPRRLRVRVLWPERRPPPAPGRVEPDMLLVAGDLAELQQRPVAASFPQVIVERATSLDFVPAYQRAMDAFRAGAGALAREVWPTTAEDFGACMEDGAVVVMRHDGVWAGVAAAARASEWALDGYLIHEELLDAPLRGRGLGVYLQQQLIRALDPTSGPTDASDDGPLLFGTIHHTNHASLATALRCGRAVVATYWFVDVEPDDASP